MTFVTAKSSRIQFEKLSRLLVSAFPGSTIYQHTDMLRVPYDMLNNKVDAVLLEAEMDKANGMDLVRMLRRQKPNVPIFIIAEAEDLREESTEAGADGYFVLPEGEQQLLDEIRLVINKERVS